MSNGQVPEILYKYQPYDKYSLQNLINGKIWLSTLIKFNDPFEFKIRKNSKNKVSINLIVQTIIRKPQYFEELSSQRNSNDIRRIVSLYTNEEITQLIENYFLKEVQNLKTNYGITCFSEIKDNILMWSHYADGHRGFCIGYDTSKITNDLNKWKKVDYVRYPPKLCPDDIFDDEQFSKLWKKMVSSKYKLWKYEKEWRLFHTVGNIALLITWNPIKEILFGFKMKEEQSLAIINIFDRNPIKPNFFRMEEDKNEYKLIRRPL